MESIQRSIKLSHAAIRKRYRHPAKSMNLKWLAWLQRSNCSTRNEGLTPPATAPPPGRSAPASPTSGVMGSRWGSPGRRRNSPRDRRSGSYGSSQAQTQRLRQLGRHHAGPAARSSHGYRARVIEFDVSIGIASAPTDFRARSMMRRFCISGVSRHSGTWPTSLQVTCLRSPNMAVAAR